MRRKRRVLHTTKYSRGAKRINRRELTKLVYGRAVNYESSRALYANLRIPDNEYESKSVSLPLGKLKYIIKAILSFQDRHPVVNISTDQTVSFEIEFSNEFGMLQLTIPKDFWIFGFPQVDYNVKFVLSIEDLEYMVDSPAYEHCTNECIVTMTYTKDEMRITNSDNESRYIIGCKQTAFMLKVVEPLNKELLNNSNTVKFIIPYDVLKQQIAENFDKGSLKKRKTVVLMFEPCGIISIYFPFNVLANQNLYYAYKTPPVWWGSKNSGYLLTEVSVDVLKRVFSLYDEPEYTCAIIHVSATTHDLMISYMIDGLEYDYTLYSLSNRTKSGSIKKRYTKKQLPKV